MWHTKGHSSHGVNITPHRYAKSVGVRMSCGVVMNHTGDQIVEGRDRIVRSGWRSDAAVVDRATGGMFRGQPCSAVGNLDANRVVALGGVMRRWIRHEISLQVGHSLAGTTSFIGKSFHRSPNIVYIRIWQVSWRRQTRADKGRHPQA